MNVTAFKYALCTCIFALGMTACGGKQRTEEGRVTAPPQDFDCISDRWATPPDEVGQTPPEREPSALDVDPFVEAANQD